MPQKTAKYAIIFAKYPFCIHLSPLVIRNTLESVNKISPYIHNASSSDFT